MPQKRQPFQKLTLILIGVMSSITTLSCDDARSCKSNQDCAEDYYCDEEGYCTQLTAFVRCGEQKCFAPEVCVDGLRCMRVESTGGTEVSLVDMSVSDAQFAGQTIEMDAQVDLPIRDMSGDFGHGDLSLQDMTSPLDMEDDPLFRDQGGQDCQSTCDCAPGLGCVNGTCIVSSSPIYCCNHSICPPGEACKTESGILDICLESSCATACDCNSGLSCIDGTCAVGEGPLFCCDQGSCPANMACESRQGVRGMCPSTSCSTACDCSPGQRCIGGACALQGDPLFCCDQGACPDGQACQGSSGMLAICQSETMCSTACDCMPGLSCQDGACILADQPIFCCDDSFCPSGERCEARSGGPLMICEN